jgi:hypothetical protein
MMKKVALIAAMALAMAGCANQSIEGSKKISSADEVLLTCGSFLKLTYLHENKDSFSAKLTSYASDIDTQKKLSQMKLNYMLSFAKESSHEYYLGEISKCYGSIIQPMKEDVKDSFEIRKSLSKSEEETQALEELVATWLAYVDYDQVPPAFLKADLMKAINIYKMK